MVDDAVFLQKCLPREGAQQEIHPHGQNKDQYDKVVPFYLHPCENHCQWISEQKADQRADKGEQERLLKVIREANDTEEAELPPVVK